MLSFPSGNLGQGQTNNAVVWSWIRFTQTTKGQLGSNHQKGTQHAYKFLTVKAMRLMWLHHTRFNPSRSAVSNFYCTTTHRTGHDAPGGAREGLFQVAPSWWPNLLVSAGLSMLSRSESASVSSLPPKTTLWTSEWPLRKQRPTEWADLEEASGAFQ